MIKINLSSGDFIEVNGVRVFNGFPYLMTRLTRGFYHIILLPSSWSEFTLHLFANFQFLANQLDSYLMINKHEIYYYSVKGQDPINIEWVTTPPAAELYFCGRLYPVGRKFFFGNRKLEDQELILKDKPLIRHLINQLENYTPDPELISRKARLIRLVQAQLDSGRYVEIDDRVLGGKKPNEKELISLSGYYLEKPRKDITESLENQYKVPSGLIKCKTCGSYKGRALYPDVKKPKYVVPVQCLCENHNRCARCGETFIAQKLNSNYFGSYMRGIIHFSGYRALGHVCDDLELKTQPPSNYINLPAGERELKRLEHYTDEALVALYNRETMITSGWVSARGVFLSALTKTFKLRGIDISQITNKRGGFIFGPYNYGVLFGKKVINMRYLVRNPEDPGERYDPQVIPFY